MAIVVKITVEEFNEVESKLIDIFGDRYHFRGGAKDQIDFYGIGFVKKDKPGVIYGQITGSKKNYAKFEIKRTKNGVQYSLFPLPGNKVPLDVLEEQMKKSMKLLYDKVTAQNYSGPMSTKYWKGFYMQRSKSKVIVGSKELEGIEFALKMGEIDQSFKELCISKGVFFKHY